MDRERQLDKLLRQAGEQMEYADGSAARVWAQARRAEPRQATPMRWLVPAALVLTAVLTMAAVPQARAAVGALLGRLMDVTDYMVQDAQDRPQNTPVASLVQTDPGSDATTRPGNDGDWVNALKVHIDEALYDGEFVYIKYTVDSSGLSDFMSGYYGLRDGQNVPYKEFEAGAVTLPDQTTLRLDQAGQRDAGDGRWMDVAKYSASQLAALHGKVDMVFTVRFNNNVLTADSDASNPAGQVDLPFTLDVDAGNSAVQTPVQAGAQDAANTHALSGSVIVTEERRKNAISVVTNRQATLDGCKIIVDSVTRKPTETRVTLRFVPTPAVFALTPFSPKQFFLDPVLMDGDKVVGTGDGGTLRADDSYEVQVVAPLLSVDVQTLTVKCVLRYAAHMNGEEMTIGKSFTLGDTWDNDSIPQVIEGGTFTIDLTK